jgi:hypothetical protein
MSVDIEKAATMVTPFFEVRRSNIQGYGAFATKTIRKGQRIIEYTGERISDEEADARYDESKMQRHHTFLFTLDEDTVIDGAVGGNASIYINHSCDPNCEAVIEGNRIFIYALRTIKPGEELLYDYQYEREDDEELINFYKCLCGSPKCRGTIMKAPEPESRPKKASSKKGAKKATQKRAKKASKKSSSAATKRGGVRKVKKAAKGVKKSSVRSKRGSKTGTAARKKVAPVRRKKATSKALGRGKRAGLRSPQRSVKQVRKKGGVRTKSSSRTRKVR